MLKDCIGYYGFWIWCWLLIGYSLIWAPRRYATALGRDIRIVHSVTGGWIWLLWGLYPICWGVSEGGNIIPPDSEFIFYGILDCLLIPITSFMFLGLHWKIDTARLGLNMRSYDDPLRNQVPPEARGALLHEKENHNREASTEQPASTENTQAA